MTQQLPSFSVWVDGVGILGPGLDNWAQTQAVL